MSLSPDKGSPTICTHCGRLIEPICVGDLWITPLCSCESNEIYKRTLKEYENNLVKNMTELSLGSNPRIKDCTFQNFMLRSELEGAINVAKLYADKINSSIKNGCGLLLLGDLGTGKSHLSGAIANVAISSGYSVIYEVISELLGKMRKTYNKDEVSKSDATEMDILDTLCSCDLLVLDDLGSEKTSAWTQSILFSMINRRYSTKKPLIASSNLSLDELNTHIGDRSMDRLIETCQIVKLTGESYRHIKARERVWGQDGDI